MSLQPKTKRILWISAIVIVVLIALGAWFTWTKFFREEKDGSAGGSWQSLSPQGNWVSLGRDFKFGQWQTWAGN